MAGGNSGAIFSTLDGAISTSRFNSAFSSNFISPFVFIFTLFALKLNDFIFIELETNSKLVSNLFSPFAFISFFHIVLLKITSLKLRTL